MTQDIVNVLIKAVGLVILELLRRNNKNTELIKKRVARIDEHLENMPKANAKAIKELKTEVVLLKTEFMRKIDLTDN
ncbi:MAG: hypothetical protein WBA41_08425 [Rivularia sp. (in: cyanobacteria)]